MRMYIFESTYGCTGVVELDANRKLLEGAGEDGRVLCVDDGCVAAFDNASRYYHINLVRRVKPHGTPLRSTQKQRKSKQARFLLQEERPKGSKN